MQRMLEVQVKKIDHMIFSLVKRNIDRTSRKFNEIIKRDFTVNNMYGNLFFYLVQQHYLIDLVIDLMQNKNIVVLIL